MARARARKRAARRAQEKAAQTNATPSSATPSAATPSSEATTPPARKWFTTKRMLALCTVAGIVIGYLTYKVDYLTYGVNREQAAEAKQSNARIAGRLGAKTEIVELIPELTADEIKHLVQPLHPNINTIGLDGKPVGFVTFDTVDTLCQVNPRVRIKNTGDELIESVRIEVEELAVMPIGTNGPYVVRDTGMIQFKPRLDPTQGETCNFSEKFKPGDDAVVPIWKPLIKAMLKAHVFDKLGDQFVVLKKPSDPKPALQLAKWDGQYHASFVVRLYVRAIGATAFDRTEKGPIPLGFLWSMQGFKKEDCEKILETPTIVKVVATR